MQPSSPERRQGRAPRSVAIVIVTAALTLAVAVLLIGFVERNAQAAAVTLAPDSIVGEWWTQDKDGRIRFVKHEDGTYRGLVTWGAHPRQDRFNKDPKRRARSLIGITLVWQLVFADGAYSDGYLYNPEDGDTYRIKAWLTGANTLNVRGYWGLSVLGKNQTWTRYR